MLAQNLTINTILIMYAYHLLNKVECNYTTVEHEALTMVCGLHKFRHYMLGNKFVFYVFYDHLILIYLVNKTQDFGRIARQMFLFLEYVLSYFKKPRKIHVVVNASSRLHDVYELVKCSRPYCRCYFVCNTTCMDSDSNKIFVNRPISKKLNTKTKRLLGG